MARKYDPEQIETKWQKVWEEQETFVVLNPAKGSGVEESGTQGIESREEGAGCQLRS